ncbi:AAA family ATPase [Methylophilus aquaticus]|uniref:MoxR family ATPase n=1 Tax=Methylophilus aquaticus TaxID=1971610 RepID=A0ABT9JUN3_9PROT|nr:MoxR family ATPase [Methylophilus aquaticus]MDP8568249.1 MoxR family ATPase [Methylophilus aquaticus]
MNRQEQSLADWRSRALQFESELNTVVLGLAPAIRLLLISIFARGHVLLEGNVGVGKTTLLKAAARGIGGGYQRIEGTIDLMPQDLIYYTYINQEGRPQVDAGPILSHGEALSIFFFNEINRARPQVHSLLLRVMAERSVTAFNREYAFPHLQVFADRNAVEKDETFELPGASRDRFLMEIEIAPAHDAELHKQLTFDTRFHDTASLLTAVTAEQMDYRQLHGVAELIQSSVQANATLQDEVERLRQASHRPQDFGVRLSDIEMEAFVSAGIGPRGASMLIRAARVAAWLDGRVHLMPEDIAQVFTAVVSHRLFFTPMYELQRGVLSKAFTQALLEQVH